MHRTTRLTSLLRELDDALDATGAPFLQHARPGLSDDQIDAALSAAGITGSVPTEVREWWRWHDGSVDSRGPWHKIGPGSWTALSVMEALAHRARWVETLPPETAWDSATIPLTYLEGRSHLVVTIGEQPGDLASIGLWDISEPPPVRTVAGSLAEVVTTWIRALRERVVWWDAEADGWDWGSARNTMPPYA